MLLRNARVTWLLLAGSLAAACSADGQGATDGAVSDAQAPETPWQVLTLPAPVLSAWGHDPTSMYFVGGGPNGGTIHRVRGDALVLETIPAGETLWWVFGVGSETVRAVGEGGRVLARTDGGWRVEPTGLSERAQLWGGLSLDDATHYAVGGSVRLGGEKGLVLIKRGAAAWTRLEDPAFPSETNLYKIWGPSADELYVVGEAGVALRWDGTRWTRLSTPDPDLLFTVHGRAGGPVLAVGGITRARVLRLEGDRFVDDGAPSGPPLNGVFVREDGTALVSGANGALWARAADGQYTSLRSAALQPYTLHAVFVAGEAWAVGGDLSTGGEGVVATTRVAPLRPLPANDDGPAAPDALPRPEGDAGRGADAHRPPPTDAGGVAPADAGLPPADAGRPADVAPSQDASDRPADLALGDAAPLADAGRLADARPAPPPDAAPEPPPDAAPLPPDAEHVPGPGEPCVPPRYVCAEGTHCLQILGPEGFSEPLCLQPCAVPAECDPAFGADPCCATPGPQLVRTYCMPASAGAESCR